VDQRAEIGEALARLTRGAGVAEVADEVGYSRRHLGGLLRAEIGLTPKEYQRVARFERSRALVLAASAAGRVSLADVAARAGYADQAHLAREWVRLAGCPPSTWIAEELPFVQAVGPDDGPG
jgi:AraC-like DNA-binding protein